MIKVVMAIMCGEFGCISLKGRQKMENAFLKIHISQVINKSTGRQPEMARLVFRAGVFLVVAKSEMKENDKIIRLLSPGDCEVGFRSDIWDAITKKAIEVIKEYADEQTTKNPKQ